MCHDVLQDPVFFRFLSRVDAEFATETRQSRCRECSGPLHVADFPRKPRGCPATVREEYSRRLSFTCGWCEQRSTPLSVRFLGRRVYVAVMLMLVSPPSGSAARALRCELAVPARTLKRWRRWWREDFPRIPFWHSVRDRFMPPLVIEHLPHSLLERFAAEAMADQLMHSLRFIAPLTTRAMAK